MTKHLKALILMVCCGFQSVLGQVSLDEAVRTALQSHPQLKVARSEVAIAQARLIDAGKLDNPVFEFALKSQLHDGPDREGSIFMGYSQKFPVTGKLLHQRDLGGADIKLACSEIYEVERKFIGSVQHLYIDAVSAKSHMQVLRLLLTDAEKYIKLAKDQLKLAQGSELDVGAAETERLLAIQALTLAQCDYRESIVGLRSLLGMAPGTPLDPSDSLSSVTRSLRNSVQLTVPEEIDRADVIAARVRYERAIVASKLARAESIEDWELAGGYETGRSVDEPSGVERERFMNLGVKIPLPVRKKGKGIIAEAEAQKEKARLEVVAVEAKSRAEIAAGIETLCRSDESIEALKTGIIPLLEAREKKTQDAYEQGLVDFNQIILLQQQQSRTRETLIHAQSDQAHELAKLQLSLGTHPLLQSFDPANTPTYQPGTEPKNAPFAVPVIRAVPVHYTAPPKKKNPFKGLFKKSTKRSNR